VREEGERRELQDGFESFGETRICRATVCSSSMLWRGGTSTILPRENSGLSSCADAGEGNEGERGSMGFVEGKEGERGSIGFDALFHAFIVPPGLVGLEGLVGLAGSLVY